MTVGSASKVFPIGRFLVFVKFLERDLERVFKSRRGIPMRFLWRVVPRALCALCC